MTGGTIWSAATPAAAKIMSVKGWASALSLFWLSLVVVAVVGQPIAIALMDYSVNHYERTGADA